MYEIKWYIRYRTVDNDFVVTRETICQWLSLVTLSLVKIIGKSLYSWPHKNRYSCKLVHYSIFHTLHNESINDDKNYDFHTSFLCLTHSVYALRMTSQWPDSWRWYLTRLISILLTVSFTTGRVGNRVILLRVTFKFNRGSNGLTLSPARINNYMHYKVRGENIYPFANFNNTIVEVWKRTNNFIPHFTVITYPC